MSESKQISLAVVKRLPRYYRYLGDLLDMNVTRISSMELGQKMNVTASQIRQDLNNFGCFGQQGYGYNVEILYNEIKKILGLHHEYRVIIIGAGNIGQALAKYGGFMRRGFQISGVFDNAQHMIGHKIQNLIVQDVSGLTDFVSKHPVDIAILAVPQNAVPELLKIIVNADIKGIWNFSSADIQVPSDIAVENVHLTDSLMILSYKLSQSPHA